MIIADSERFLRSRSHSGKTNTPAILVLIGSAGLFALIQRMFGAEAPRSVLGREPPTGPSPQERKIRRRSYALNHVIGESESRAVERRLARLERQSS